MVTLITILHVLVCVFLILVVLLQAGKGGGMGLSFGSTGAQTVFGGSGAGNFLTKLTAGTAVMFMLTSLTLAYFASARPGAWLEEAEKTYAAQAARDKAAREKLAEPTNSTNPSPAIQGAEAPAPEAPATPATDKPATTAPATDKPATTAPATDKPATDKPVETPAAPAKTPVEPPPAAPAAPATAPTPAPAPAK